MALIKYYYFGDESPVTDFASAEALGQALSLSEAVNADDKAIWMPDTQLLEKNLSIKRLPAAVRAASAKSTKAETILRALAHDVNVYVLWLVANNKATPADVRKDLAQEGIVGSLEAIAKNASTPAAILTTLASDQSLWIRSGVAKNASTPAATLAMLANDTAQQVRVAVANNANTPPDTLATLASDPVWQVRIGVAENVNSPPHALTTLTNDIYPHVQAAVAKNTSTPATVLATLATDPDASVREAAKNNPNYRHPFLPNPRAVKPVASPYPDQPPAGSKVPSVDFAKQDLQDSQRVVTEKTVARDYGSPDRQVQTVVRAYIPIDEVPEPRLVEEEEGDEGGGYDWSELSLSRGRAVPPPKILLEGERLLILDGNHRIAWWTRGNVRYTHIPAWLLIEEPARSARPKQKKKP